MEIFYIIGFFVVIGLIGWIYESLGNLYRKIKDYDKLKPRIDELDTQKDKLDKYHIQLQGKTRIFEKQKEEWEAQKERDIEELEKERTENIRELENKETKTIEEIKSLAEQKSSGFPWLAEAYADYFYLQQLKEAKHLQRKSHPAPKSADRVREIARERRTVEKKLRIAQGIIKYYQDLFPFLEDWLDEREDALLKMVLDKKVDEALEKVMLYWERGLDPARLYLSTEEYKKLSLTERNQLALDRYWDRSKNRIEAGRAYERYIGYVYEKDDWNVYYQGILEGREDLGRDLICRKGKKTLVIQCKRWSLKKKKVIRENHINQLFGTATKYKIDSRKKNIIPTLFVINVTKEDVTPVLYTTTEVSDRAKEFAEVLKVEIHEKFPLEPYPSIKCNVSRRDGEKIYHLPFDQQYDRTFVEEERLEKYVETVSEAEKLGFRRAFRWRGNKEK